MLRRRFAWLLGAGLFLVGVGAGALVRHACLPQARAQLADVELTSEERSRLFDALEQDVAALEAHGNLLKRVVKLVGPSVVHIEAEKQERTNRNSARTRTVEEAGSGVVYRYRDADYVLTNRHVIRDAALKDIQINLDDGRQLQPTDVRMDADTDIAVMAVSAPDLVPARLGNSDGVEIGDFVLAVGSPFGLTRSVTYGIISAKGRRDLKLGDDGVRFQDFLQTDAAINPGNSGGPLLNLRGEVIGINTAIASSSGGNEGIGFSIPINMALVIARQLIDNGSVVRAYLGVSLERKFTSAAAQELGLPKLQGAKISGITPGSPAEAAGLRKNDVILRFDGVRVENDTHLVNLVSLTEVDKEVPVVIFRDKQTITIPVKVGDRGKFEARSQLDPPRIDPGQDAPSGLGLHDVEPAEFAELGLELVDLSPRVARQLQIPTSLAGVLVTQVDPEGPAAGKIDLGEIIDLVELQPVNNVADLEQVLTSGDWVRRGLRIHVLPGASASEEPRTVVVRATRSQP
jgi:serine protease Do